MPIDDSVIAALEAALAGAPDNRALRLHLAEVLLAAGRAKPSFSAATTQLSGTTGDKVSYGAFDLRGGALVGTTLWRLVSPYAVVRAFGGPVYWQYLGTNVTGTDAHHYQVGAGLTLGIARRADRFVEGVPLGERSLAAGGAVAF